MSSSSKARKGRAAQRSAPERPAHPRRFLTRFAPLLILAACVAVYANSLNGPFLFDDQRTIEQNVTIRHLWPLTDALQPPPATPVTGRPLVNLSLAFNFAVGGLEPRGYHLFNVTVHILAALALFAVLRRTFARPLAPDDANGREPGVLRAWHTETGAADLAALLCTLLWAVHPLNSEVMNYLTQRSESMMALCYLLALYCAIRGLDTGHPRRWDVAAGVAVLSGVASKEVTLTAPLVIVLWDRVFAFPTLRAAWTARWRLYVLVTAACALYLVIGRTVYGDVTDEQRVSSWTYLLNQGPMILQYVKLTVWPARLIFDYGVPGAVTLHEAWPGVLAVAVLFAAAAAALRAVPRVGFWAAWIFITLAPSSSVVPISAEVGAERRMYLPLVGVVVLLVVATAALMRRFVRAPAVRPASWAIALVLLAALSATTIARNSEYRTSLSIWQTVVDRRPQWRAHEHLSMYLRDAGRIDESIAELRIAAKESPNSRHALAAALLERGEVTEGIARFREFIRERPNDPDIVSARRELAAALLKSGDAPGAIDELRAVVAARPGDLRSHLELAAANETAGNADAAVEAYRAALQLHPDDVVALSHLGVLLASRQQGSEALALLQKAIALEPNAIGVRLELIRLLLAGRQFADAEHQARAGLAMAPNSAEAHNLLGVALASQGRIPESAREFAEAVRLDPGHRQARANLQKAEQLMGSAGSRKE